MPGTLPAQNVGQVVRKRLADGTYKIHTGGRISANISDALIQQLIQAPGLFNQLVLALVLAEH